MTKGGLRYLKKLEWEIDELRDKAEGLMTRIQNFYWYEEDDLDRDAYMRLSNAGAAMQDAVPCITDARLELQKAYELEKALIDFNEGLLSKEYKKQL